MCFQNNIHLKKICAKFDYCNQHPSCDYISVSTSFDWPPTKLHAVTSTVHSSSSIVLLNILFCVLQIQEKPDLKSEEKAVDDGSSSGVNDGGDSHANNGPVQY
jgi:hypothetical protein